MGRLALGCLAALAAPAPARPQVRTVPPLVFTGIPDQDERRLVERFGKVAAYLEAQLGVPVRDIPVKSYPAAVTAFTNGQVQLAWFGGFTGVQARRAVPGAQAIAQGAEDAAFKTYLIANAATGLKPGRDFPKDAAGRTFTFGARASTSGRLMPESFIRQAFPGQSPEQVFSRVGFSGDHTRTIQLVQSGAFAVGAVDYSVCSGRRPGRCRAASSSASRWPAPSTTAGRSWRATSRSRRSTASRAGRSSPNWRRATRP